MAISEKKMDIVINNYFKNECDVNTSIREAFEKGFRIGVKKGYIQAKAEQTEPNSSEKPNNCDTCRNKGFEGCEQPCLGCGCCGLYEPKDEPQTEEWYTYQDEQEYNARHGKE